MGLDPEREPRLVKRRVGYLPDAVGFYGGLTGRQNLRYTASLNGLRRAAAESAMDDVLEQVGLTDRADDRVDTYSRGMRQRLGIADALVKSPDLLILDEPTTAIDPLGVVEILDLLRRLVHERGPRDHAVEPPADPGPVGVRPDRHLRRRASWSGRGPSTSWRPPSATGRRRSRSGFELPTPADVSRAEAVLRALTRCHRGQRGRPRTAIPGR